MLLVIKRSAIFSQGIYVPWIIQLLTFYDMRMIWQTQPTIVTLGHFHTLLAPPGTAGTVTISQGIYMKLQIALIKHIIPIFPEKCVMCVNGEALNYTSLL